MTTRSYPHVKVNAQNTARGALEIRRPSQLPRALGKDAGPFIVHGHWLASLYRTANRTQFPFIVLKIRKESAVWLSTAIAYLRNNEDARMGAV